MTQEWILTTLMELGFTREEAEIYLLLYKDGPKKAKDITDELKIYKRKTYRILKKLQNTKIIQAKPTQPIQFEIIPFDNFLDFLIQNCLSEANLLEQRKSKLFTNWKSITGKNNFDNLTETKR